MNLRTKNKQTFLALLGLAITLASVQGQTARGRLTGLVTDPSAAAIPAAKLTIENLGTGERREVSTDDQGRYAVPDLPTGMYKVTAEAKGFQSQFRNNIQLAVATVVNVDFSLPTGTISEVVEVQGVASSVEQNAAQGSYFGNKQLADLPINGRDYGRFTLLTPGAVARSNFIADMGFNGGHSIQNNFSIDGVDASRVDQPYMANGFERGARLLTGSLDTIAEVRVQTSNYKAEYGRSSGSSVAIVSKSGTNDFHGSVFEFFRNDVLDARNFFNTKPAPMPKVRYNNFGGNLGGRIIKDRTFFFANYEGSRQRVGITGTGTVPSALMRSRALATSPELKPLLDEFPLGTSRTSNPLVDNYSTAKVSQIREDTGSIKVDHNFTSNDHIYARFNLNDSEVFGPLFGVTPSALGINDFQQVPITTTNGALGYTKVINPRVVLDLLAGIQRWGSQLNSELPTPQTNITGLTTVVGSRRFSRTNSQTNQYGGTLSWVTRGHTVKFGGTYWHSGVNPLSRDLVTITYTSLDDFIRNSMNQATISRGTPGSGIRQDWFGLFVQDTWQLRPGLTLDIGLRYDFGTPNDGDHDIYRPYDPRTGDLAAPGAEWYAMNKKTFAPRLALAWQPMKKLVVRTGYGIFYQQYPPGFASGVITNTVPGNTTLLRAQIPGLKYPLDPFLGGGTTALPNVTGFNWDKPELYAQQWNFTLQYELPGASSVQAAYVGNHSLNLRRGRNINFINPATGLRPNTKFANINLEYNDAQSVYHGLQLNYQKRFSAGVQATANYTYAKVIDNVQDYGLYSTQPQDNNCLGPCERGLGSGDIRHNFTYQLLYDLPFGKGKKFASGANSFTNTMISGWQISSLGLVRSGIATMVQIGVNTFGNANLTNQRPDRVAGVSIIPDNQTINNWYNPAAFSLPRAGTFGNAGRTVGIGPDFAQCDVSLTKDTPLTESTRLQFRAEIFNILNHPNFDFANAVFGTPNFGRIFNTFGRTIGFGTSRQIQLSLRLRF